MATPRSIQGFEKAISLAKEDLAELDVKLQNAEADSSEEEDLIAEKAEKGIELAQLEEKFEEFKAKKDEPEITEETPEPEEEKTPEPEEEKWPETMLLRARSDIGFMVNPFTHQRIESGYTKVAVDGWIKSQVKAGFLQTAED